VIERLNYKKNDGRITLKALIWIIILSSALYSGYKLSFPYFSYYMLKTDVGEELKLAHMYTDASLRRRIAKKAKAWSVPITADDVFISYDFDKITIRIRYSETITFLGRYKKKFIFKIDATGPMKKRNSYLR